MGEIIQRDNPLTRHLNNIAALNEQHGTRREGGLGVPTVREEVSGGGVSLPPAQTISPEEEAELKAAWEAEQAARNLPPKNLSRPVEAIPQVRTTATSAKLTDFLAFDLVGNQLLADNGDSFPLTPEMVKALKVFAFNVSREQIAQQLVSLATSLGIDLSQAPGGTGGANGEVVPPVPGDETS